MTYVDILYIYAIARAGYIPQLFSLRLPNPDVIYELLERAEGKAMVYEPELENMLAGCPVPAYRVACSATLGGTARPHARCRSWPNGARPSLRATARDAAFCHEVL